MEFNVEVPNNYEQKCLCVLVLDVSASMEGEPINQLNRGIQAFYNDITSNSTTSNRLEVCLIEFSAEAKVLVEPSLSENFTMPTLKTISTTALVDGVKLGIEKVMERKNWYKETKQKYYRPWVILITDGLPDRNQDIDGLATQIKKDVENKSYFFFALGVEGADMNILKSISSPSMPPEMLEGLKFSDFFKWLSASMTNITSSKDGDSVSMANPASWMKGFKI
jgi:uncharacterized protein YegL